MNIINLYFGNILFSKVEQKENFTIYAASLTSSFGDGKKQYALAFVPTHMAILDKGFLRDFHWQNIQTRYLTNGYKIRSQRWDLPRNLPTPMFNVKDRTKTYTKYMCEDYPMEMVLLHDPKKKSNFQYHNRMNMMAALMSFRCAINLIDDSTINYTSMSNIAKTDSFQHAPRQQYYAGSISEDTTYMPRDSAGTKYTFSGGDDQSRHTNGYAQMSLDLSMPALPEEEHIDDNFEFI
jgi:hypothetical protein